MAGARRTHGPCVSGDDLFFAAPFRLTHVHLVRAGNYLTPRDAAGLPNYTVETFFFHMVGYSVSPTPWPVVSANSTVASQAYGRLFGMDEHAV